MVTSLVFVYKTKAVKNTNVTAGKNILHLRKVQVLFLLLQVKAYFIKQ